MARRRIDTRDQKQIERRSRGSQEESRAAKGRGQGQGQGQRRMNMVPGGTPPAGMTPGSGAGQQGSGVQQPKAQ